MIFRRLSAGACAVVLLLALVAPGCSEGPPVGPGGKVDDWAWDPAPVEEDRAMSRSALPAAAMAPGGSLGLAAGGAKDVGSFRENIEKGYLPLPTDITYEGLFYEYTFDTGQAGPAEKLFSPSYTTALLRDPISKRLEPWLAVGLNSSLDEEDFGRKRLNLVVVLDISGSMGSSFDQYYYDRFGNRHEVEEPGQAGKSKMRIAAEAVAAMLDRLRPDDRLGIVLFDDDAYLAKPMRDVGQTDLDAIREHVLELEDRGGTNMAAGLEMGLDLLAGYRGADPGVFENRIVFLTDAMPNQGETSGQGLFGLAARGASEGLHTTFIGIGVDFNTALVEAIGKIRGSNYCSVHSAKEFRERMDDEFEFMVTPVVFDLVLTLEAEGHEIEKVYGSPEADEATGELMRVNTLFPSRVEGGETRGGVVLLRLRKTGDDPKLVLKVRYEDRQGRKDGAEATVGFPAGDGEFAGGTGVRKAVLLARYADLMKNWLIEEHRRAAGDPLPRHLVDRERGIAVPDPGLGKWERQSVPLQADVHYRELFGVFLDHLRAEMELVGDPELEREAELLEGLFRQGR